MLIQEANMEPDIWQEVGGGMFWSLKSDIWDLKLMHRGRKTRFVARATPWIKDPENCGSRKRTWKQI